MNFLQKVLIFIAVFFMKVFAAGTELTINTGPDTDLGEITPPNTYTVHTNTPTSRTSSEDAEITSIFTGIDGAAAQSCAEKIANRVLTPYFKAEILDAISSNATALKLSTSCAAIEENSTVLNAVANPQPADVVSGWPWWYRWLSSFIS